VALSLLEIVGRAISTMLVPREAIREPRVVLERTIHLYCKCVYTECLVKPPRPREDAVITVMPLLA
jgi:hypothetical protein